MGRRFLQLTSLTVEGLTAAYADGSLSPVRVMEEIFEQATRLEPHLNAFCVLDAQQALSDARKSALRWRAQSPLGPLDGIPISVKDLSLTRGWPTRRGSLAIGPEGPWDVDAPAVARCREGGAVLFGKTTVPEFGAMGVTRSRLHDVTRNPWNPAKTPGGSSGGAAAATAAGLGVVALASDGAGSIRNPAALTGLFGFKPSFGVVPDFPSSYLGDLAVVGPISRCVRDAAVLMSVIAHPDARDPYAVPPINDLLENLEAGVRGLRIAYSPTLGYAQVDPEIADVVAEAVTCFKSSGASVELLDQVIDNPKPVLDILLAVGLANGLAEMGIDEDKYELLDGNLLRQVQIGRSIPMDIYLDARRQQDRIASRMSLLHQNYDLLLTPTLPVTAFDIGLDGPQCAYVDPVDWKPFSGLLNLSLQPGANVPCGMSHLGLPIGLQIIGPRFGDALVLQAARAFERVRPFKTLSFTDLEQIAQGEHPWR